MAMDPQVRNLLATMQESRIPAVNTLSVEQARQFYRGQSVSVGGPILEMAEVGNLNATGPAGQIPLRVYRPNGLVGDEVPTVIYIHGGGWVMGDLESHDRVCRKIAHVAGCAVTAVDYRLAPEHPFPAGPDDVIAATRWIAANARSLGIDENHIGICGDSAGGSMSAVACIAARDRGPALRCQILIYPGTDNSGKTSYASRIENAAVPPITRETMQYFMDKFLPYPADGDDWRASPLLARDHSGLPPALIFTGGYDPLHDEGAAYATLLEKLALMSFTVTLLVRFMDLLRWAASWMPCRMP
ncbi:MAG TPA: alpha/beta hydrolase [Candidatus Saccharimonadales bacterium]|nr:alpha/beta hydrolase [Candidatus Saccharimonadales bacterium]